MTFVYVKRLKDGKIIDIPKSDLAETLKRGGFQLIPDMVIHDSTPKVAGEVQLNVECPLCNKMFKNEVGLLRHKRVHV